MAINSNIIYNSNRTGWGTSATWNSGLIDLAYESSVNAGFHIVWTDVTITFYLVRSNYGYTGNPLASSYWENFTAAYRAIDPAWVDPLIGDATSQHLVSFQNVGARFVKIGWSASNWGGVVGPSLEIAFFKDKRVQL